MQFKRPCHQCGKYFNPSSKSSKLCEKCRDLNLSIGKTKQKLNFLKEKQRVLIKNNGFK